MSVSKITDLIHSELELKGYKGRIIPIQHLVEIKREIEVQHRQGMFDENLYLERLIRYSIGSLESSLDARSIIITAAPQPQQIITFGYRGRVHRITLPPTYSERTDEIIEEIVKGILRPEGFDLYSAPVPEKLAAVHSGLAKYGKNNIVYIEGMGSFFRLRAFLSNLTVAEDEWSDIKILDLCSTCNACIKKCPTGAITPDRFLVKAERCLTYHNERLGRFPNWIKPSWHKCIMGCMDCQLVCPENKKIINWLEDSEQFSEKETELMLGNTPGNELPVQTVDKFRRLYLWDDMDLVRRNLQVLIKQRAS
jgi:epoxyqueuosine reductase